MAALCLSHLCWEMLSVLKAVGAQGEGPFQVCRLWLGFSLWRILPSSGSLGHQLSACTQFKLQNR